MPCTQVTIQGPSDGDDGNGDNGDNGGDDGNGGEEPSGVNRNTILLAGAAAVGVGAAISMSGDGNDGNN